MKINRRKVALSMIIPFLTVFIVIFIGVYGSVGSWGRIQQHFFEIFLGSSPLWGLSVIICFLVEVVMLKPNSEKKKLRSVIIIETIIATVLSLHFAPIILVIGGIGNIGRYHYLIHNDRVFK
ncbi:MAG: formate-dependent nitrite reductase membrane component NrfD [Crocinitomix sp.]|jgi:formate-dependent nitrite reductase membrane component NrfD